MKLLSLMLALVLGVAGLALSTGDSSAASIVLYDQSTNAGGSTGCWGIEGQAADDFVIPANQTWSIDEIDAAGAYSGTTTSYGAYVLFYSDADGQPGDLLNYFVVTSGLGSGDLTLALPTPQVLGPGHYWVSVETFMPDNSFWLPCGRFVVTNSEAVVRTPSSPTGWSPTGFHVDARFSVLGSLVPDDLAVSLAASPNPVRSTTNLSYTITIRNAGAAPAGDVSLANTLPAASGFVSAAASQGSCVTPPAGATGTMTCSLGGLAPGDTASIQVVVKVNAAGGSTITDTVSATSATLDVNTANNTATVTTSVFGRR